MFQLQLITPPTSFQIQETRMNEIAQAVSEVVPDTQKGIVHIAFLPDEEVQTLNREHRGIDSNTDVISFHYYEDFEEIAETDIAGELIFSESKVTAQAEKYGHSREDEFAILLIHSLLHIIGFDHEDDEDFEDMWTYESFLREKFWLSTSREFDETYE